MGKISKIPIFPIFLTDFAHVVFVFSISLQPETNYLKTKLTSAWQIKISKQGPESS